MAFVSVLRAGWTADVDYWTLAWPHILQGIGMPYFFVGLTALALSSGAAKDQPNEAGLMTFLRPISSAIGTAITMRVWSDTSEHYHAQCTATVTNSRCAQYPHHGVR